MCVLALCLSDGALLCHDTKRGCRGDAPQTGPGDREEQHRVGAAKQGRDPAMAGEQRARVTESKNVKRRGEERSERRDDLTLTGSHFNPGGSEAHV